MHDMDLSADSSRIDLWCTYISEIGDDSLLSRYDALLSADERARQVRFRFAKDQRRHPRSLRTGARKRVCFSMYRRSAPAS